MKRILLVALAASLAVPAVSQTGPTGRAGHVDPIIVQPPARPDVTVWTAAISDELNRNLRYPGRIRDDFGEGTVSIRFDCGDDGQPTDLALDQRSGSRPLDRLALRAVSRIRTLHPLPARVQHGQSIRANIIFANSEGSLARQQAVLRHREAARMAREQTRGERVLVLTVTHRADG